MQVILTQDVKGLGKKNQMVKASDGYARNYLFPKGIAIEATQSNIADMESKQKAVRDKAERERQAAFAEAKRLSSVKITIKVKTGENGKLYGALTTKDISEKLMSDYGIDLDKNKIKLEEPIKQLGDYTLEARLYPQIVAKINLTVE